jgi:hypothetical protein
MRRITYLDRKRSNRGALTAELNRDRSEHACNSVDEIICHEATSSGPAGQANFAVAFRFYDLVPTAIGRCPESSRHDFLDEAKRFGFAGSPDVVATGRR